MADIAREMEDFKAANRTFGGEWKLERKGIYSSSPDQLSSIRVTSDPSPPRPIHVSTYNNTASRKQKNYNYNSPVTWTVTNSELKRQRRVLKYKSYAVETKLKTSLLNGFRWMKHKYCEFVSGY